MKNSKKSTRKDQGTKSKISNVVNLAEVRSSRNEIERRQVERYFLKEILQFFCVLGDEKLYPVELLEGSSTGCSFRVPYEEAEKITSLENLGLRIYMSKDSYLLVGLRIVQALPMTDHGRKFMRFGCEIDKTFQSYPAYQQLLRFIDAYSALSVKELRVAAG